MKKPQITIRFGASHDDITVDGHTFTRHKLGGSDRAFLRNVTIDGLIKAGTLKRTKKGKKRRGRAAP